MDRCATSQLALQLWPRGRAAGWYARGFRKWTKEYCYGIIWISPGMNMGMDDLLLMGQPSRCSLAADKQSMSQQSMS